MVVKLPVIKHIINAHTVTTKVLYAVAKFEFTSLIPIFAKIVVIDVKKAASKANISQVILSPTNYNIYCTTIYKKLDKKNQVLNLYFSNKLTYIVKTTTKKPQNSSAASVFACHSGLKYAAVSGSS